MIISKRQAQNSDKDFARQVHHKAYKDVVTKQFGVWDEKAQDEFFESDWNGATFEILMCNEVCCGYVSIEEKEKSIHIQELVIHPDFQNQGIGTKILQEVIEQAALRKIPVRLETLHSNQAINLYLRLGFYKIGLTDTHILMQWSSYKSVS